MKIYLINKLVDWCAFTTLYAYSNKKDAEKQLEILRNKHKKKGKYATFEIEGIKLR